jgi:predicted SAM-dependent methyltransferase
LAVAPSDSRRARLLTRVRDAGALVRGEARAVVCSVVGLVKVRVRFDRRRLNRLEIGCGASRKPGFITSDLSLGTDFPFDLRLGLPFPDASLDFIYSEHVLEHLTFSDIMPLLRDCHRALKPAGVLSVVVPNARIYLEAYLRPDGFDPGLYCTYDTGLLLKTRLDYVNYMSYMGGEHRHMFDEESTLALLKEAGFREARLRAFDPALDQESRRYESLYAEGAK